MKWWCGHSLRRFQKVTTVSNIGLPLLCGNCVLRYDNEAGKGDHKHIGEDEIPYIFTTPKALLEDFWNDVDNWRF